MNHVALFGTLSLALAVMPAQASEDRRCHQVETTYLEWQAATLIGEEAGSRVNVRPEPRLDSSDGSYGLVGDEIAVIRTLETPDCETWHNIWFPESGWQGWVHRDHVRIDH